MSHSLSDDLKDRGLVYQCNDWAGALATVFERPQLAYVGFDCTASSLHVGHLMPIMLLRRWQKAGNRPIVLFGSATTLVGDPTGKESTRPMLTKEDIAKNKESLSKVFRRFLDVDDPKTGAIFVDNSHWWESFSYLDLLRTVGPLMTVNYMVHFETVARRLENQQPLSFLEFNYMILQGYDFVHLLKTLGCRYQFGGSDQWGNMIVGSDLIHKMQLGESYILTTPLLTTASGKKMGKTENGAVWLDENLLSDFDYWQFWRNCDDQDCEKLLLAMTDCDPAYIKDYLAHLGPERINEAKVLLANEQTKMCRGIEAQQAAFQRAQAIFSSEGSIEDKKSALQKYHLIGNAGTLLDFLAHYELIDSKSAGRKLFDQRAIKIEGEVVTDCFYALLSEEIGEGKILSIGKKKHYLIVRN